MLLLWLWWLCWSEQIHFWVCQKNIPRIREKKKALDTHHSGFHLHKLSPLSPCLDPTKKSYPTASYVRGQAYPLDLIQNPKIRFQWYPIRRLKAQTPVFLAFSELEPGVGVRDAVSISLIWIANGSVFAHIFLGTCAWHPILFPELSRPSTLDALEPRVHPPHPCIILETPRFLR